jgi:hypothetical protein
MTGEVSCFESAAKSGILGRMENRSLGDVGGTPGGLAEFAIGFVMSCIGVYLLFNQVSVVGSYWNFWGTNTFGITLIPLLFGVGMLFWKGRSAIGWLLTIAGALFVIGGVLANMQIYLQRTSLFNMLIILILVVGGIALIARSVQPHRAKASEQ